MAAPALDLDRTARDFDSLDDYLWSLYQSVFPQATDRDRNNSINLMRWAFSSAGNNDDFYKSRLLRQAWTGTATDRKGMIALGRRTAYTLAGQTAASCDLTITLVNGPLAGDVVIPAGTLVRTADAVAPIIGETQAVATITAGATSTTVAWKHAQTRSKTYTATLDAFQQAFLPEGAYLEGTAAHSTVLGAWSEQATLALSEATDRHFTVSVDQNDKGTVRWGDDINGDIPTGTYNIAYEIGGGEAGNVDAGSLTRMPGSFSDSFGTPATLTVTNALAASGGSPRETVNAARVLMPLSVSAARTSTTREDFEIHALLVSGVARALMLSSDEASFVPENEGRLYVVPTGGGTPSSTLLDTVETAVTITYPPPITFRTLVVPAVYLTVDIVARAWVREGYSAAAMKTAINAALATWFDPIDTDGSPNPNVDFGYNFRDADGLPAGELAWSDLHNAVRDVVSVRKVGAGADDFTLNGARADLALANHEFPAMGTVTVINGDTGTVI